MSGPAEPLCGKIESSRRTPGPELGSSFTIHPAANGYLLGALQKLKVARKELDTLVHYTNSPG